MRGGGWGLGWQKLLMLLVNIVFVKQNINQVLLILFTKLVNCTFASKYHELGTLNRVVNKYGKKNTAYCYWRPLNLPKVCGQSGRPEM